MNTAKATPNPVKVTMPPPCAINEAAPPVDCTTAAVVVALDDEFLLVPEPLPSDVEVPFFLLPPLLVEPLEVLLLLESPVEETSVCEACQFGYQELRNVGECCGMLARTELDLLPFATAVAAKAARMMVEYCILTICYFWKMFKVVKNRCREV